MLPRFEDGTLDCLILDRSAEGVKAYVPRRESYPATVLLSMPGDVMAREATPMWADRSYVGLRLGRVVETKTRR